MIIARSTAHKDRRVIAGVMLLALLGIILAGVLVWPGPGATDQPVYDAATVVSALRQHPEQWSGRTVLVRGVILPLVALRPLHASDPGQLPEDVTWQGLPPGDNTVPRGSVAQVALGAQANGFDPQSQLVLWVQEPWTYAWSRLLLRHVPDMAGWIAPHLVLPAHGVYRVQFPSPLRWVYGPQVPDGALLVP